MKAPGYAARFVVPFGVVGVRTERDALTGVEFLPGDAAPMPPVDSLARETMRQIAAYLQDADFHFDLPLQAGGSEHQRKVWQAMLDIPRGEVLTYGDIADMIGSSPRAVGRACGDNPIPIIIPCHRVVSKSGMGGFMHQSGGSALDIKQWLLRHEGR